MGSQYDEQVVIDELINNKIEYSLQNDICSYVAGALADGQIIGWFQGRSEAGARAPVTDQFLHRPHSPI